MDECAPPLVAAPMVDGGESVQVPTSDAEFVELVRLELPRVQRIARMLTGNADAADDVVAEAIARSLPRWRAGGIDDCPAYLRRVVVNLSTRRWRRRALVATRIMSRGIPALPVAVAGAAVIGRALTRSPSRLTRASTRRAGAVDVPSSVAR